MDSTRMRRIFAPVAVAAGLTLVVSACSQGGGGAGEPTPSDTPTPGPLEQMWSEAYGEFTTEDANAQQNRMEQIVAECMTEQGWEYTPVDYSQMDGAIAEPMPVEGDGPQWGTEEYAKELGYGISTYDLDAGGETPEPLPIEPDEADAWVDPNAEYVESLSETAREAYYEALHGPQPTEEEMVSGEWEYDPANAGCYGRASQEVYDAGNNLWEDEKYQGLLEEMNLIYERLEDDPKVAEARSRWSGCMADAGYPGLADSGAAQQLIYSELEPYWEKGEEPPVEVRKALGEKERSIATADFRCSKDSDVEKVQVEALHRAEQDFIDTHRAELEELMAALKAQQDAARG